MLAQNFKTPTDLRITDKEFDALTKVLGMLERAEIWPEHLNMERIDCGTAACMMGWARRIGGSELFATEDMEEGPLSELFMFAGMDEISDPAWVKRRQNVTPSQAAVALRNFLTHGEPRWDEAVAA